MRPGWPILFLILTGLAGSEAWAETFAPDYKIVPVQQHKSQPIVVERAIPQATEQESYLLIVGSNPEFQLEFADVRDSTGSGFDDPVLGSDRRSVAVAVFERVSQILDGEPGSARILLDSRSPWLNEYTLAVGIPYFQCIDGFQKPIIHKALRSDIHVNQYEGDLLVNFTLPLNASVDAPRQGQYDLYTILFHEITHILGFVGFSVESDGRPRDCGGARMLPETARYARDAAGKRLWVEQGDEIVFLGQAADLPSINEPVLLDLPQSVPGLLRLATSELRVSGHWLPADFENRPGVLMLREPFPSGQTRRNMTPETKSFLQNVMEYQVNQDTSGLSGSWIDAELDGQGFVMHFISKNRLVVYFFGFTDSGDRLWMIGLYNQGFDLGETITIPLLEASGGRFDHFVPAVVSELPWGELRIRFKDCLSAEATLSGIDGSQDMLLFPLVGVNGLNCY